MKKSKPSESEHSTLPLVSGRDLRREAEAKLSKRRKKTDNLPTTDAAARLVQELQVHQIELDMQNEELVQSRAESEAAYRQYVNLYDLAPVGYLTLARDGAIRKINPAGANLLGMEHDELVKRRLSVFVSTESLPAYNIFFETLLTGKGKKTCELEFEKGEDEALWARLEAICFEDRQECNVGIIDISDRKQAERQASERMKELQAFYSLAEITEKEGITLDNLYQEVADILSKSCQYPQIACARVVMGNSEFRTKNFAESAWMESAPVKVNGSAAGKIEIGYLKRKPKENEGPFLKEERLLLNAIAERLGRITERVQAEEALRVSEEKYRVLFDMFPIGITISDGNGKILESNYRAERLLGISKEEQEQRAIDGVEWQIIRTDGSVMPPEEYASVRALKDNRLIENIEMGIVKGQGIVTWLNVTAVPLGREVVVTYHDITGRKQAEENLRESEERYRLLFNSMTEGFALHELVFDQNGEPCDYRFLDVNRAFEELTGLKRDDIIGRLQREVLPTEDPFWFKTYCKVALTGESIHLEHYSSQLQRHYEIYAYSPASNQFAVVFKDITERKQAEGERERLLAELDQKNKELEGLIYIASHDMRSPLVTVQGFCGNIQKYCGQVSEALEKSETLDELRSAVKPLLEEKIPNALRFIDSSSLKMHTLVNGLLRLSRVGRATLQKEEVEMPLMLQRILDTLAFQIEKCNAQVIVETPLAECYGDKNQLNQVFSNLLDNAVKYRDAERPLIITISSRVEGQKTIYTIADTGIGISSEDQEKIWTLFHRVVSDETVSGEGLGLALVKRIVERHYGRVWVESDFGIGSRFHVELPLNSN